LQSAVATGKDAVLVSVATCLCTAIVTATIGVPVSVSHGIIQIYSFMPAVPATLVHKLVETLLRVLAEGRLVSMVFLAVRQILDLLVTHVVIAVLVVLVVVTMLLVFVVLAMLVVFVVLATLVVLWIVAFLMVLLIITCLIVLLIITMTFSLLLVLLDIGIYGLIALVAVIVLSSVWHDDLHFCPVFGNERNLNRK